MTAVGDRLTDGDARHLGDHVVQAFQVLDVERRIHVDPRRQDLLDILVALGMPRAGRIRVGELVHQHQLRLAADDRVDVHLGQGDAVIFHLPARQDFQCFDQLLRLRPVVSFDVAHHHVHALLLALVGGFQHGIGLAHAGHIAQKDLEPAALPFFGLDILQQLIGIGTIVHEMYCIPF